MEQKDSFAGFFDDVDDLDVKESNSSSITSSGIFDDVDGEDKSSSDTSDSEDSDII